MVVITPFAPAGSLNIGARTLVSMCDRKEAIVNDKERLCHTSPPTQIDPRCTGRYLMPQYPTFAPSNNNKSNSSN